MAFRTGRQILSGASVPSEMSLEVNVLRYLANCLECGAGLEEGSIAMASPTQNEEALLGYDSQVKLPDGRYVLLQFKRPLPVDGTLHFKVPSHQASALLKSCPASSFLVLPAVGTNDEMWGAGAGLLGRALIVDAWDLYMPLAASATEGRRWVCSPKTFVRTVRIGAAAAGAGTAVDVSQGRGRDWLEGLPSRPISSICGGTDGYGFVARGGTARARGGGTWGRKEWQEAAAERTRAHAEAHPEYRDKGDLHVPASEIPTALDRVHEADYMGGSGGGTGVAAAAAAGGGRYAIRIGDA